MIGTGALVKANDIYLVIEEEEEQEEEEVVFPRASGIRSTRRGRRSLFTSELAAR